MGSVAARFGCRQFRLDLVVFLRADRLLVVQHLIALHGRFGQCVVGIGSGDGLLRRLQSGIGALISGTLLRFINRDQHFAAPHRDRLRAR